MAQEVTTLVVLIQPSHHSHKRITPHQLKQVLSVSQVCAFFAHLGHFLYLLNLQNNHMFGKLVLYGVCFNLKNFSSTTFWYIKIDIQILVYQIYQKSGEPDEQF